MYQFICMVIIQFMLKGLDTILKFHISTKLLFKRSCSWIFNDSYLFFSKFRDSEIKG